jgi:ankyrin repeat protein
MTEEEAFEILKSAYKDGVSIRTENWGVKSKDWDFLSQDIDYAKAKINENDLVIKDRPIFKIDRTDKTNCELQAHYAKVIKALVTLGAKVNIRNYHGTMPLHHYIVYGSRDIVYSLIDNSNADLNAIDEDSGKTPLQLADSCMKGLEPIKKLLRKGADPKINGTDNELFSIKLAVSELQREKALSEPNKT